MSSPEEETHSRTVAKTLPIDSNRAAEISDTGSRYFLTMQDPCTR